MKGFTMKTYMLFLSTVLLGCSCFSMKVFASDVMLPLQPYAEFSKSDLVLSYTQIIPMLEDRDPIPLLRVYANGRVHVHYPKYMKRAGDYIGLLSSTEIRELLSSMERQEISSFNRVDIQKKLKKLKKQKNALYQISDSTIFFLEFREANDKVNKINQFKIKNLSHKFARYPSVTAFQTLFYFEKKLQLLIKQTYKNDIEIE